MVTAHISPSRSCQRDSWGHSVALATTLTIDDGSEGCFAPHSVCGASDLIGTEHKMKILATKFNAQHVLY